MGESDYLLDDDHSVTLGSAFVRIYSRVSVFVDHIKGPKERRALLQKLIPNYSDYTVVSNNEFDKWLHDYLLADTGHSIESKMRRLKDIYNDQET